MTQISVIITPGVFPVTFTTTSQGDAVNPTELQALIQSLQTAADTLQTSIDSRNTQIANDRDDITARQSQIDSDNSDIDTQEAVVNEDTTALGYVNDAIAKLEALVAPPAPPSP